MTAVKIKNPSTGPRGRRLAENEFIFEKRSFRLSVRSVRQWL